MQTEEQILETLIEEKQKELTALKNKLRSLKQARGQNVVSRKPIYIDKVMKYLHAEISKSPVAVEKRWVLEALNAWLDSPFETLTSVPHSVMQRLNHDPIFEVIVDGGKTYYTIKTQQDI